MLWFCRVIWTRHVVSTTYKIHVKSEHYLLTSAHILPCIPRTLEKITVEYQVAGVQQIPQKSTCIYECTWRRLTMATCTEGQHLAVLLSTVICGNKREHSELVVCSLRRPEREASHLNPTSADFQNEWSYTTTTTTTTTTPPFTFMACTLQVNLTLWAGSRGHLNTYTLQHLSPVKLGDNLLCRLTD